jgi:hypothetical protein
VNKSLNDEYTIEKNSTDEMESTEGLSIEQLGEILPKNDFFQSKNVAKKLFMRFFTLKFSENDHQCDSFLSSFV